MPHQLFINNQFVDSISGKYFQTINPTDESVCDDDSMSSPFFSSAIKLYVLTMDTFQVICKVSYATKEDVDIAVQAAKEAFEGDWGKMNARDRGKLLYRYSIIQ